MSWVEGTQHPFSCGPEDRGCQRPVSRALAEVSDRHCGGSLPRTTQGSRPGQERLQGLTAGGPGSLHSPQGQIPKLSVRAEANASITVFNTHCKKWQLLPRSNQTFRRNLARQKASPKGARPDLCAHTPPRDSHQA